MILLSTVLSHPLFLTVLNDSKCCPSPFLFYRAGLYLQQELRVVQLFYHGNTDGFLLLVLKGRTWALDHQITHCTETVLTDPISRSVGASP
jgi:hypothetical protein